MSNQFILPIEQIINPTTGRPVFNARLFFGRQDATDLATNPASRVPVFFVDGSGAEVALAQPVRTNVAGNPVNPAGAPVQIRVQVNPADTAYSFLAQTDGGAQVLYQARVDEGFVLSSELGAVGSDVLVGGVEAGILASRVFDVRSFGATGNGTTNDTAACQSAINAAIAAGGGIVAFHPAGNYSVTSLSVQHGLTLMGFGSARITRPANSGNWVRTFTTQNNLWDSTADSLPVVFKGLVLDGNRANQGAYANYELEQAHLLFLTAPANKAGRLRAIIDGCTFLDSVADGISQFTNVDLTVSNCFMSNCFRGGLVITGGHSRLRASNLSIKGEVNARGIDFEIDGGGFNNSFDVIAELSNIEVNAHFDVGVGGNSRVVATNITYGDISNNRSFNVSADGNASIQINNSSFLIAAGAVNQFRFVNNISVGDCHFTLTNFGSVTGQTIGIEVYANAKRMLKMSNCSFELAADANLTDNFIPLFHTAGNTTAHKTLLSDCYFGAGIDVGINLPQGGFIKAENCIFDSVTALAFGGSASFPCDAQLADCEFGAGNTNLWDQGTDNASTSLYVSGSIPASKYNFTGIGGSSWNYRSDLTVFGAQLNPNSPAVKGMPNDTYKTSTQAVYGAGAAVMYVGSALAASPFFAWVPVNRS
jgi:hypothetical protein